ncbi:ParB/RepB/Spo0J family partition protein [Rhodoblastus acidophilus]|uniref:ParB/RepB/Spo0J family partition protein n=1 Tax=Candidatus Rhodoblastus alkanivorans TaxID=2954117 RepID=A0ABS9ZB35_9HYPH|nr:ParB/RepB/Spo0J family partition protein [Candidatus Rhodoblastus alkanivorans]MCI4680797.1 ParB/RepB/Spo0J family partition protein [Candidatus Rhodoblastus alkanivorans]MCI4684924.1 ParB/RepB/Spo0J family partition protein [Candidatus Rhodoblastus alkanivorans]MDI4643139.1 ParB/RepB/Spo0J family partition protein [Rhodoblastus acidophilus]
MANAVQKIVLSASRDIPFNKLVLSQSNVRRVKAGISVEELAEDIARRTLLQSLSVRPVLDAEGQQTGMFEIPAGGRRFRALELLVKQKRLAKNAPVPCVVREGGLAEEDSLAENVQRVALHPLDQFRAFQALREKGLGDDDIAARFFVTPTVVKQRLRLAAVSNTLLDVYAEDGMTLEQLMAFTVTNDHARQEQVWEAISRTYNKEAYYIRRVLTEGAVKALDRRAQFVGVDAYEAAGGVVLRDLFQTDDDGGWLQDPALLDRLVIEKLQAEAEALRPEGWKWIAIAADFPYGHTAGLRRLTGEATDFTEEEEASLEALRAEYEALETQYADSDELPEEADLRLAEIEAAIVALEQRPLSYDPSEIARAGVFVSLDDKGALQIVRGFVRLEDEAPVAPVTSVEGGEPETLAPTGSANAAPQTIIAIGGAPTGSEPEASEEEDVLRPLSDRLVTELTAHRTLALRNSLANDPEVALRTVLHALCLSAFYRFASNSCLEITAKHTAFSAQAPGLAESASARAIEARHQQWVNFLPKTPADLWDALAGLDGVSQASLLAHCASLTVNVVKEPWNRRPDAMAHGDTLARAVHLDLAAAGWKPTVDNYLGRVPKARILDAVREAKGEQSAQLIDHLKKGDMASEAERLLDGAGWLPEPLRLAEIETAAEAQSDVAETLALPDFLAGEEDEAAAEEPEQAQPQSIAAE